MADKPSGRPPLDGKAPNYSALVMAAINTLAMRVHMGEAIDWKREVMNLINLATNGEPLR